MGWSAFWKRFKEILDPEEASLSTALAKVEPRALPYREREPIEAVLEPDPPIDLMYTVQGGDGLDPAKLKEFMDKSRRRAIRYFQGKEVKHRIAHKSKYSIEFVFNRDHEPQHVPGEPVRIRWVNKVPHNEVDA